MLFTQLFLLAPNWKDEIASAWVNSRMSIFEISVENEQNVLGKESNALKKVV